MKEHFYRLAFIILIVLTACGPSKKDPKLIEAYEIHKSSLELVKMAREQLNKTSNKDEIRVKLESKLDEWCENMVEVPGFPHDHDPLGCPHHHHAPLKLTPDDMLLVQKELRDSVQAIHERVLSLGAG